MPTIDANPYHLYVQFLFGLVGAGYFMYGKKSGNMFALCCGLALGVFPYFVDTFWIQCLLGLALAAAPFLIRGG